jgi:hypothetical protein
MTRVVRGTIGTLGAAGVLALIRLGSFTPYTAERDVGAIVRLAWRARGEHVRECRELSPEELQRLPVHMREKEVCEGRLLPYRLVVVLDSAQVVDRLVHGAGAREDRPLYVYEDLAVQPGTHHVVVTFAVIPSPAAHEDHGGRPDGEEHGDRHEGDERGDRHEPEAKSQPQSLPATPPRLTLDTTVTLAPRRVLLVTYNEEREQLVVRGGSER